MTPASASDARRSQSSRVASRCARGACGFVSARTRVKLGERILRRIATPTRASMRETPRRDARERAKDGMLTTRAVVSGFAGKAHLWRRNSRTRAHPGAMSPRWSSLFRVVGVMGQERCEDTVARRGQSCVRAAFAADLRVGTPLVVRGDIGRSRGLDGNGKLRRATRVRVDDEWGRAGRSRTRKRLAHAPRRRRERRHAASRRVLLGTADVKQLLSNRQQAI